MIAHDATDTALRRAVLLLFVFGPFVGTVYAIYTLWQRWVTPLDVALMIGLWVATGLGITVGFHRMLTHRSFQAPTWVRSLWLALGSMAVEGGAVTWSAVHAEHHVHADQEGDPHSPLEGFVHAHLGWLFGGFESKPERFAPHLLEDEVALFFERTFVLWVGAGLLLPFAIGGLVGGTWQAAWMALLWGGLVRIFLTHHITWSVNSVCHVFGSRMFETKDVSRNNFLVGLLAFGEGWHNNHHAFPRSAEHGMAWWQFDLSAQLIRLMERLGLAWEVYRVPEERRALRRIGQGRLQPDVSGRPSVGD
jgi:stearoyl-CoA desaturase (delta-9 desaturase)